jgi:hypothetical protein
MTAIRTASGLRTIVGIKFRDTGNTLRTALAMSVKDTVNTLRSVFGTPTVTLSTAYVNGFVRTATASVGVTNSVTASAAGGASPYTYLWARNDGGVDAWRINSPTSASTSFASPPVAAGAFKSATFACTVTPASGTAAVSATVTAEVDNNYA